MSNSSLLVPANTGLATSRERRVAVRYPGNPDAACHAYTPSAGVYTAWVCDISATGVALLVPCEFEPGALLTLELENAEQNVSCVLRAQVVHALEVPPDGRWLHGCAFEKPLTAEELWAFAD
jgi:PilZ domain